jgi:precorrin-8X/cobalt-precorrin-8 methylmutase
MLNLREVLFLAETGIVMVSSGADIDAPDKGITGRVSTYLTACLPGKGVINMAISSPDSESLIRNTGALINDGVKRIILMFTQNDQQFADTREHELRRRYPDIALHTVSTPLDSTAAAELLADGLEEYSPEVYGDLTVARVKPSDIEAKSRALIDLLIGKEQYTGAPGEVVKRMVHASGDGSITKSIRIHPGAVEAALKAIGNGSVIITDSRMTAAGINRAVSDNFGCQIYCALDAPGIAAIADGWKLTRSAAGIRLLASELPESIVVIGNAPTALAELLRLTREDGIIPAVIIGIPVGFVQAREVKMALTQQDIPYITVTGSRGGSALASAAMNALRILAEKKSGAGN